MTPTRSGEVLSCRAQPPLPARCARQCRDDSALTGLQEVDEIGDLGGLWQLRLHALDRLRGIQVGPQKEPNRRRDVLDSVLFEVLAFETDRIHPITCWLDADGLDPGQGVLRNHRIATDIGVTSNTTELMDGAEGADRRVVLHLDMPSQGGSIAEHRPTPNMTVVRHMGVGHEQIVIANGGQPTTIFSPPMHRAELAESIPVPDLEARLAAAVLQILRLEPDTGMRKNTVLPADPAGAVDLSAGADLGTLSNADVGPNHSVRPHRHAGSQLGRGIDHRRDVDLLAHFSSSPISTSSAPGKSTPRRIRPWQER